MTENQLGQVEVSRRRPSTSLQQFRATPEAEARILLLIDGFSRTTKGLRSLEGRIKLAKLDFLLRYPTLLLRILEERGINTQDVFEGEELSNQAPIDNRMMRYRYGPWDPSYYALLGSLIGRGLVQVLPLTGSSGLGYRTTPLGSEVAKLLTTDESFSEMYARIQVLRKYLDNSGTFLKNLLYRLPEVSDASWKEQIK